MRNAGDAMRSTIAAASAAVLSTGVSRRASGSMHRPRRLPVPALASRAQPASQRASASAALCSGHGERRQLQRRTA
ncbi:MAG: hypothetical protein QM750_23200 [Rubrivivax sp.]